MIEPTWRCLQREQTGDEWGECDWTARDLGDVIDIDPDGPVYLEHRDTGDEHEREDDEEC